MSLLKYFALSFFIFCLQQNKIHSQITDFKQRLYIEGNYNYGFVAPHHDFMAYFITDHVKGYQVNIGIYTNGNKSWQHHFNYPRLGIGYYHSGLGNNEVYGKMDALYFYTDRIYLNTAHKFNIGNKICFGLCYINKRFDLFSNNFDLAIGTKINAFIRYELEATARISPLIQLKIGAELTHASNGNIREPNKGLNIVSSFVGMQYSISDQRKNIMPDASQMDTTRHLFRIFAAFGHKALSRFSKSTFPLYSLSLEYGYNITNTGCLGLAMTGYKDFSIQNELEQINTNYSANPWDNYRLALNLSYEIKMDKLAYVFQPGIYLKNSFKKSGIISNRIGLRYYFKSGLIAGVLIKAHWIAVADVVEWTIGYQFTK